MKRLDVHQSMNFRPLTMVGADLSRVLELLTPCQEVRIVADDVEYDSVDEFLAESKGKTPKSVKIFACDPYLTIDFTNFSARLYVSTSDIKGAGIFAQLVAHIRSCERKPRLFYSYWYAVTSTWVIQASFALPMLVPFKHFQIWLILANVLWVAWVFYVQLRRFSLILPIAAQDPRTFWQRNSDSVAVAVFSALLGALGGAAATKAADRLWPTPPATSVESIATPAASAVPAPSASSLGSR